MIQKTPVKATKGVLLPQTSSDNENMESEEEPFVLSLATASPLIANHISSIAMNNPEELSALTALATAADSIMDRMLRKCKDWHGRREWFTLVCIVSAVFYVTQTDIFLSTL